MLPAELFHPADRERFKEAQFTDEGLGIGRNITLPHRDRTLPRAADHPSRKQVVTVVTLTADGGDASTQECMSQATQTTDAFVDLSQYGDNVVPLRGSAKLRNASLKYQHADDWIEELDKYV